MGLTSTIVSTSLIGAVAFYICLSKLYRKLTMGICDVDQDMSGKTILITGASAGIGKETARDLARRNARVLLACRNIEKACKVAEEIKASTGNTNVIVKKLELTSFESVRKCAQDVIATEDKLHVLINNAGCISDVSRQLTADGCEVTMQTNHFGHFLLTLLLLDLLKKSSPSRIINLSSSAHIYAEMDLNDLTNKRLQHPFKVYFISKLANILFTKELARRLHGTSVTVNAVHPGLVKTEVLDNISGFGVSLARINFLLFGKTSEEGAQTSIQLAVDPHLEKITGRYFAECKEHKVSKPAEDEELAKQLFEISEQIVGFPFGTTYLKKEKKKTIISV